MKKLLFIGDVVGKQGCEFLGRKLREVRRRYGIDVAVVNGENSAPGNGIDRKSAEMIMSAGADLITTGNHAFHRREHMDIYDELPYIIRPINYPEGFEVGRGLSVIDCGSFSVAVINLLGTVSMEPVENPFNYIDRVLERVDVPNVFVDFHAEATSEKKAMGYHLAGRVTGVFGTHTHVQTADECILGDTGTAYITDAGMTGPERSCLGVEVESVLSTFRYRCPMKFKVADGDCFMCGVIVDFDEKSGKSHKIERIIVR